MAAEQQGYLEDFEKLSARASRNGGAWAGDLRRRAMECFCSLGFPSTRDEEWKYTSLDPLRKACLRTADVPVRGLARGWGSVRIRRLAALRAGVSVGRRRYQRPGGGRRRRFRGAAGRRAGGPVALGGSASGTPRRLRPPRPPSPQYRLSGRRRRHLPGPRPDPGQARPPGFPGRSRAGAEPHRASQNPGRGGRQQPAHAGGDLRWDGRRRLLYQCRHRDRAGGKRRAGSLPAAAGGPGGVPYRDGAGAPGAQQPLSVAFRHVGRRHDTGRDQRAARRRGRRLPAPGPLRGRGRSACGQPHGHRAREAPRHQPGAVQGRAWREGEGGFQRQDRGAQGCPEDRRATVPTRT